MVEQQAAFLFVALRQKILAMPHTYARKMVGLADTAQAAEVLKKMALSVLGELKNLPEKMTDPNWLDTREGDSAERETVGPKKASDSK